MYSPYCGDFRNGHTYKLFLAIGIVRNILKESLKEELQERFLLHFAGIRYEVGLPRSHDIHGVPCHFHVCQSCLKALNLGPIKWFDIHLKA